jgi:putative modified peptide
MTDAVLTKKQGLMLLQELITNPAFRKRFTDKPAAALLELGVPAETVVNLNPACIAPRAANDLASAADLQKTVAELERNEAQICLTMLIPHPSVS